MSERILITGGSGFLGYHLIHAAKAEGLDVDAGVRAHSRTDHLRDMGIGLIDLPYDTKSSLSARLAAGRYRYIVHAAAVTRAQSPAVYQQVNVQYAQNLAQAAMDSGIPLASFVYVSSLAAIGPLPYQPGLLIDENTIPQPVTAYGRSKRDAEQRLKAIDGLPLRIIRPTAVYGPRERDLLMLFRAVAKGVDAYIGKAPQLLSFVYATDLAKVIIKAALFGTGDKAVREYNISDGRIYGRYDLADMLACIFCKKPLRIHLPTGMVRMIAEGMALAYRRSATTPVIYPERILELTAPNWGCDISRASRELDYRPAYDLEKGLHETIAWYKAQQWL
ncbi:NAD(P)-dependent oxidoreductase [Parapedobacter sp. ISTM3]|uniref:Nucleoside-diphosphate-sugar epimerase n=1 Tax=Parapedobacter luteus TaxID=623280 RepID=A0A1T5A2I6_9SPHI|nr:MULTISPECIES: NAD(P)-dependent oxidoreductase [Parapedobacter]MBK1440047.1 NAD(P)-dependent oxidoreductase [Parapedobacter sp. ISTM3]SKB28833.1 Nucleoside-diphosphate-sugar epimerase [Parapedobacter luteus]